ncbi:transposase [Thermoflexus sp.]|uniref:transposase n=1 Tax=Thermoflexus sp. TaxID=1969742 RepID=UPI0035E407ED
MREPVGVDLGLSSFLVLSDGTRMKAPKPLAKALRRLRRRSRPLSRKQKGSRNSAQASWRLARWHRRIRNLRRDFLHPVTTGLARPKPVLGVEPLNVWGIFLRFLAYKAQWYGAKWIEALPDFPSTRRCSRCGWVGAEKVPVT